jgi:plastocyanin
VRRLLPLTALLLLAPAGCGDDEDAPGRTVNVRAGETVRVVADEYSFDPQTIVLQGRGKLTLELENNGVLAHNLKVFNGPSEIGGTPTFTGGKTRAGTLALEKGEYELVCTVADHAELGMTGKLSVR